MKQTLLSRSLKSMFGQSPLNVQLDPQTIAWISLILERYEKLCAPIPIDRHKIAMDLTFTHSNGCPLDFQRFATHQNDIEFALTITQIQSYIDRRIGKLRNGFVPMFAKKGN
jgi:hypothetical protein